MLNFDEAEFILNFVICANLKDKIPANDRQLKTLQKLTEDFYNFVQEKYKNEIFFITASIEDAKFGKDKLTIMNDKSPKLKIVKTKKED